MNDSTDSSSLRAAYAYESSDPNGHAPNSDSETVAKLHYAEESNPLLTPPSGLTSPVNSSSLSGHSSLLLEEHAGHNDEDDLEPTEDEIKENVPENKDFVVIGQDVDLCTNLKHCLETLTVKCSGQPNRHAKGISETYQPDEVRLGVYEKASKTCTFYFPLITENTESSGFYKIIKEQFIEQALRKGTWRIIPVATVDKWDIYGLNGIQDIKARRFLKNINLADAGSLQKADLDTGLVKQIENMFAKKSYLFEQRERTRKQDVEKFLIKERQARKERIFRHDHQMENIQNQQVHAVEDVRAQLQSGDVSSSDSCLDTISSNGLAAQNNSSLQQIPARRNNEPSSGIDGSSGIQGNAALPQMPAPGSTQSGCQMSASRSNQPGMGSQGYAASTTGGQTTITAQNVIIQAGHITIQNHPGGNMTAITDTGERYVVGRQASQQISVQQAPQHQSTPVQQVQRAAQATRPRSPLDTGETKAKRLACAPPEGDEFTTGQRIAQVPQQSPQQLSYAGIAESSVFLSESQVHQVSESGESMDSEPCTEFLSESIVLDAGPYTGALSESITLDSEAQRMIDEMNRNK